MSIFYRRASAGLSGELARIEGLLLEADRSHSAEAYNPKHSRDFMERVRRHPARLRSLLVADTCLIDAFVNLGCQAGRLRSQKAEDPRMALKQLTRLANQVAKSLRSTLRRLPGGEESQALGALLFVEATNALGADEARPSSIQATLGISADEQTLVRSAWRARTG
jgi:hypothetical protein